MKKQKIRVLNFNKEKIANLAYINSLFGGSGNCGGDPGGSNTKDKSEEVKNCPKPAGTNSGKPQSCISNCVPDSNLC